jgi:hypothetical protein
VQTFSAQPLISSTILANTDNTTSIATTAWTNTFWTYVKTQSNTWSSAQTFSAQPLISSTILANTDNSTNIATTAWANTFWTYVRTQPYIWSGTQTLSSINVSVLNISTATVNVISASSALSAMTVGANLTTGTLSLGSANASTTILGSLRVDSILPISGLTIGSVLNGTGSIQIGNGTTQTTNIIIGNGAETVTGSDKIVIGKTGKTLSISGTTTINGGTTTISPTGNVVVSPAANVYLGCDSSLVATSPLVYSKSTAAIQMVAATDITLSAQNNYIGPFSSLTQIQSYKTLLGGADVKTSAVLSVNCTTNAQKDGIAIKVFDDTSWYLTFLNAAGTACGSIRGAGGSEVNYYTASDRRLKTDIRPMDRMMDNIMKMKPSNYTWISSGKQGRGFIAQEVFEIFPEMRNEEFDGTNYYGLDYSKFTPYLVKAFQELKTDYETRLGVLEARLIALESR